MRISINPNWVVRCSAEVELALPATSVWGQLRDFQLYARQEFFHGQIQIEGGLPRCGAQLRMSHRYAGVRVRRHGRLLIWREGAGFSFSDLSLAGPRRGFPHVLTFRLEPLGEQGCRLHVRTNGLWTARLGARLWLWWVFSHIVRSVRNELLMYQLWRKRQGIGANK